MRWQTRSPSLAASKCTSGHPATTGRVLQGTPAATGAEAFSCRAWDILSAVHLGLSKGQRCGNDPLRLASTNAPQVISPLAKSHLKRRRRGSLVRRAFHQPMPAVNCLGRMHQGQQSKAIISPHHHVIPPKKADPELRAVISHAPAAQSALHAACSPGGFVQADGPPCAMSSACFSQPAAHHSMTRQA